MFDVRQVDLRKLNSLTKYPSIETYHKLGERGRLTSEVQIDFGTEDVYLTEKVDGTNARIILLPGETYIIGSREELLYARGDLIIHGAAGVVETLKPIAEQLCQDAYLQMGIDAVVVFGEVYGGNIGGKSARQYTGSTETYGFRVFDMVFIKLFETLLAESVEAIAAWRDHGGQAFAQPDALAEFTRRYKLSQVPMLAVTNGGLPTKLEATYEFLQQTVPASCCLLDSEAKGKAEGLVMRNKDRTKIAKVRFEDYERTLVKR